LNAITDGGRVDSFAVYYSPNVAHLIVDQPAKAALVEILIMATRFKLEIDSYGPLQKLLTFEMKPLGNERPREYTALIAMNLPGLLFTRMKVGITLSTLERLRSIILTILSSKSPPRPHSEPRDNREDN